MERRRFNSIERIRGYMCLCVMMNHFYNAFIPNSDIIKRFSTTPLNIVCGTVSVKILFAISGFVLAYKYFCCESINIPLDVIKRYFRLMIPGFVAVMFAYILMKTNSMANLEVAPLTNSESFLGLFNDFEPKIYIAIIDAAYASLFKNVSTFVGPMWTMYYEMMGSLLVMFSVIALKNNVKCRVLYYIGFLYLYNDYYSYFIVGMIVADIYINVICKRIDIKKYNSIPATILKEIVLVVSAIYVCLPHNLEDSFFEFILFVLALIVAMVLLIGDNRSKFIEKYLKGYDKVMIGFGKISFGFYLLHWPIIESLSCKLYLNYYESFNDMNTMIIIIFAVTLIVTVILAILMNRYVEKFASWMGKQASKILE